MVSWEQSMWEKVNLQDWAISGPLVNSLVAAAVDHTPSLLGLLRSCLPALSNTFTQLSVCSLRAVRSSAVCFCPPWSHGSVADLPWHICALTSLSLPSFLQQIRAQICFYLIPLIPIQFTDNLIMTCIYIHQTLIRISPVWQSRFV